MMGWHCKQERVGLGDSVVGGRKYYSGVTGIVLTWVNGFVAR